MGSHVGQRGPATMAGALKRAPASNAVGVLPEGKFRSSGWDVWGVCHRCKIACQASVSRKPYSSRLCSTVTLSRLPAACRSLPPGLQLQGRRALLVHPGHAAPCPRQSRRVFLPGISLAGSCHHPVRALCDSEHWRGAQNAWWLRPDLVPYSSLGILRLLLHPCRRAIPQVASQVCGCLGGWAHRRRRGSRHRQADGGWQRPQGRDDHHARSLQWSGNHPC
mmetsp:Transcript_12537/g.37666  ORF Transcript_12537/g.37666 Transcript_12537/m.37666 type:complete len:221 (+) Transcript_12537:957-1619(+)